MGQYKPLKIQENAAKFLNSLESIEAASPLTVKSYKKDLEQAFSFSVDEKSTRTLSEEELLNTARKAMIKWKNLSPASRNRKGATLKSFFNYLHRQKLTERRLSSLIVSPKVPKKLPNYMSVDEAVAALKAATEPEERLLFLLMYGGGLRVSEACSLKWSQVDLSSHTLRILGKGNKERLAALPATVIKVLSKTKRKGDFVWGAEAFNTRTAYDVIRKIGIKAGLMRPLHPHALRHSFATHLLSSGANLRTLQELLGHTSLTATEKYTHLSIDQLARTMSKHHPLGDK
jgi:integrase/recombinase XerC/integrase/recombinase XerD